MTVEGPAVYLTNDVQGDWMPCVSFRFKQTAAGKILQQAWYDRRTGAVEWRNVPEAYFEETYEPVGEEQ